MKKRMVKAVLLFALAAVVYKVCCLFFKDECRPPEDEDFDDFEDYVDPELD